MTISYNWISEYIPLSIEPEKVSQILTSIGLEVESMERYESIPGGLQGLVVGEVRTTVQHPSADKLKLTTVDTGNGDLLQIVCGAPNVAAGQKVIVAREGVTIYPVNGEPVMMKAARIRGELSAGMICAEDEIGIGQSHEGIVVLPATTKVGTAVSELYDVYSDWIYEIGLTPNRMDAMSHLGVARDVCAYLAHHEKKDVKVKVPAVPAPERASINGGFQVFVENTKGCRRYTGVAINGIKVAASPQWLQVKLKSIGQRPINNIVDVTNYLLHDTGQPLHAFDANEIAGKKIVVKNLPEGTSFTTLDEKERKLSNEDLMICDGDGRGLCIAGVFGGLKSGVKEGTTNIFLESAWFNPVDIRKTSFRHNLRTDAATRFEKNVDISDTLNVLQRAAAMIAEVAGGQVASPIIDVYPSPENKRELTLGYRYLEKLSGKNYEKRQVEKILTSLGFEVSASNEASLTLKVPYSKPDIELEADIIEEVMRIDGYDNVSIPTKIMISPSTGAVNTSLLRKEKTSTLLTGAGFSEIFTNSITNAAYFDSESSGNMVKLLNNLSAVHNAMRPGMLETGLESVAYNLNRKNTDLRLFEFGKTYSQLSAGRYSEEEHLCLFITGKLNRDSWKGSAPAADVFYIKGVLEFLLNVCGLKNIEWSTGNNSKLSHGLEVKVGNKIIAETGMVRKKELERFDIRQDVFFGDVRWSQLLDVAAENEIRFESLPNQLPVVRDLAMIVDADMPYHNVESAIRKIGMAKLKSIRLFDIFESEKLGEGKKSLAISFTFLDEEKTLTDSEIDGMMSKIMRTLEQELRADIRKGTVNAT
jgi:phenylalanyl-tRNA synthetase beta chain